MSGLGAWSFGFYHKGMSIPNPRVAAGVLAFKHALIDNGYGHGIDLDLSTFGASADRELRAFQGIRGLTVDGVIGPKTAAELFATYYAAQQHMLGIPDNLTAKQCHLESGDDPVAQGYADSQDEGIAQLHMPYYTSLTLPQVWDPKVSINKLASEQANFHAELAPDWDGAVAAWNVGSGTALAWVHAGKPVSGDIVAGVDWYARATRYVGLVKTQQV